MEEHDLKSINGTCPNCGYQLHFVIGTNNLMCDSCGSTFEINSLGKGKLDDEELDYEAMLLKLKNNKEVKKATILECKDCGGSILLNKNTIATKCPYCGSNKVIIEDKEKECFSIAGVIPFKINEENINNNFKNYIKHKFFLPRKLKKGNIKPELIGIYIPFYTFDSKTSTKYRAERGDYYYETRTIRTPNGVRKERVKKIRWRFVSGIINKNFDDILVSGSNNNLNSYINKIKIFNFKEMEKYQESFLLGYGAENTSISLENGLGKAKNEMDRTIHSLCVRDIGGDTYRNLHYNTNFKDVTFKEILAPIYHGYYNYQNKMYHLVVNGQTGQFTGNYPYSKLRIALVIILGILVTVGFMLLMYYYQLS